MANWIAPSTGGYTPTNPTGIKPGKPPKNGPSVTPPKSRCGRG